MAKGDYKKSTDSIVPLRARVRDGKIVSLLDHDDNEMPGAPVTAATNVTGGIVVSAAGNTLAMRLPQVPALVTVACGNSISALSKWNAGGYWGASAEIHLANALSGSPMLFKRMVASTRSDQYGVYGYSGQTLPTILSDIQAQWFDPLATANITPGLVIGTALLENDIVGGATIDAMKRSLASWIRNVQYRWPGAVVLLCTPRPSFSYNTPALVANYQGIRDHILSLDDGSGIFAARLDGYENKTSPGTPLGTSGAPIYTDASVHPNAKGALINARQIAATLRRISDKFIQPFSAKSTNMALDGSAAASGTNVTGTVPTGATVTGSANATYVVTTEQPGFLNSVTTAQTAGPGALDLSTMNFGQLTLTGAISVSPFAVIELVSGADNLRSIELAPRFYDMDASNAFQFYIQDQTGDAEPDWKDGDILTLRMPPMLKTGATGISSINNYLRVKNKIAGGNVVFRVQAQGVGVVS